MHSRGRGVFVVLVAVLAWALAASAAHAAFGVETFTAQVTNENGTLNEQAGSHPFEGATTFRFNTTGAGVGVPDGNVKDIRVDLPPGLISNPQALPQCTDAQLTSSTCPVESQVGTEELAVVGSVFGLNLATIKVPLYNMAVHEGQVARFSFFVPVMNLQVDVVGGVRSAGDYGLFFTISDVPQTPGLVWTSLTFWGVPADPAHDPERGETCVPDTGLPSCVGGGKASTAPQTPFLTLPTKCGPPLTTTLTVDSYQGDRATAADTTPIGPQGCDKLPFDPSISVTPDTTQADAPVGTTVILHVPQSQDPHGLGSAHLKDAVVTLPAGMSIDPSAANGLEGCTDEQIGIGTDRPVACPPGSKIGTVAIDSPLLPGRIEGPIHLGQPVPGNPYRIFLVAEGYGVSVRLAGSVTPDPRTGQLTTRFSDNPQVPFTDLVLHFDGGPRAPLATPQECGAATTTSTLVPYSGQPAATPSSSFMVDADGHGGGCGATPFALDLGASTQSPLAGAFSPFTVAVARADRQQTLSRLDVQLPPGLLGMLSRVTLCGEEQAAQGTCPEESKIGTTTVSAGAGPQPFSISGPVYLTGPYAGAPFGLSIAVRAIAGPFDLGTVVVRAAIRVDPHDSHLTVASDPLPTILQGIPLRLRRVDVAVGRDQFMFNPTSCSPLSVGATLTSAGGATQALSTPFQVSGCERLAFKPKLTASTSGLASRHSGASLHVKVAQGPGEANIRSVAVTLPRQLPARLTTINKACLEATFAADPATCPPESHVGTATAATPVLSQPLSGPAYLVSHGGAGLPSLEVILRGQGITVDLSGSIAISPKGVTSSTFPAVPDVPIRSFELDLPRGPFSALAAPADLCAPTLTMPTTITGQNGKQVVRRITVSTSDCGVRIVGRKVRGRTVTLTLKVPGAGRVRASGRGMRTASRTVRKAGRTMLKAKLSKRGVRMLRARHGRRHARLTLPIHVGFTPAKGKASKATASVTFRR
jgi:hypothetical protein